MKLNISATLNAFKLVGYILLLLIDEGITVLSMWSVGHSDAEKIGLAAFGFIIVLLGAWVFLSGIRSKGPERVAKLSAWAVSVALIVSINWAFTRTMIRTQSSTVQSSQAETESDRKLRESRIESYQKQVDVLMKKLDIVNVWREADRAAIQKDIDDANAKIDKLSEKPEVKQDEQQIQSMNVFEKMASPIGGNQELMADIWFVLVFLVAQLFTVLAAPKSDDKPTRKRREHKPRESMSIPKLVGWWVTTNWMGVRTGKSTRILPRDAFDKFTAERFPQFPLARYEEILQAAIRTQAIDGDEIREADETTAIKRILASMGKKKEDQPELF